MVIEASSFRDPAGRITYDDGIYIRDIAPRYYPEYRHLMDSGLYAQLARDGLLIPHQEIAERRLLPEQIPFISYPQEWCFSQLKEAALVTLKINRFALDHGMILKDASAYNIQWYDGRPVLIDTLSFIRYQDSQPWMAYRQFLEHFAAPLLLMAYRKTRYWTLEGVPIDLVTRLLPRRTMLRVSILLHFYLQTIVKQQHASRLRKTLPLHRLRVLLDNLYDLTDSLKYKTSSDWSGYRRESYSPVAQEDKYITVAKMLNDVGAGVVWDIGANTGLFSSMAARMGYQVIATDRDHDCIEQIHQADDRILGLVVDLCQPTPSIGWGNTERPAFLNRIKPDTILALALLHHLCIGNNIPLYKVAELLASKCNNLIIEWVPPDDPMAIELAGIKEYPPYNHEIFEAEFGKYFTWNKTDIEDSLRSVYYMRKW